MIVIGGSLGGMEALSEVLAALPGDFPLPIAVVLHRHKDSIGMLVPMLQRESSLPVREVEDKALIEGRCVHICPPDYHLLIDEGCFSLSTDDLVHFARPSLDVLFESAADVLGPRAVAVVLTGAGSDGALGAQRVAAAGGTVLVQNPSTAQAPWMPSAALAACPTAQSIPLGEIAPALVRLARVQVG